MPILCLEGPSAVGKTTTAAALAADGGAYVVPEVNVLFERPADEPPLWYLERQVERWRRAVEAARTHPLVVLDGDPFQPLWYNAAYGYVGAQRLDELAAFYRPLLERGALGFPDLYVVLGASEATLRARKEGDAGRRRGHFERHLRFIEPQRRYFRAMQAVRPERVLFLETGSIGANARAIRDVSAGARPEPDSDGLFDHLVGWLLECPSVIPPA